MSIARFTHLLEQITGLSAASTGATTIEGAVRARAQACGIGDVDAYWDGIGQSRDEMQKLIEAVVVPETWFFRDPQAFAATASLAVQEWRSGPADGVLRLLSLPCSTGEEAYTMAMALIDAGVPTDRFRIDAIDISSRALATAQRGLFGGNSFRGGDLAFRERHFERTEQGWRISDAVSSTVGFMRGNMLDPTFLAGHEPYDIVFCRNLLIYFGAETQKRAIAVLKRLIAPHGMLFVGHSETGAMNGQGLASARIPMAFAFRHAAVSSRPEAKPSPPRPAPRPPVVSANSPLPTRRTSSPPGGTGAAAKPAPELDALHRLADRGQLAEAARGCEHHMRERGMSTEALLLLGLIKDAAGDDSAAAACYRKALYLEPDHGEALGHLSLLLKKQGDASGAQVLNDRLRRLNARGAG